MDIDRTTRLISEGIARSTDRRGFLKRAGQTAFFTLAAFASGHLFKESASAEKPSPGKPPRGGIAGGSPACSPPGPYCNRGTGDLSGCHGGQCHSHLHNGKLLSCELDYRFYPGTGCWTTRVTGGYWLCCDCRCKTENGSNTGCGCAQFSTNPWPGIERVKPSGN